jgi:hypothetical protein
MSATNRRTHLRRWAVDQHQDHLPFVGDGERRTEEKLSRRDAGRGSPASHLQQGERVLCQDHLPQVTGEVGQRVQGRSTRCTRTCVCLLVWVGVVVMVCCARPVFGFCSSGARSPSLRWVSSTVCYVSVILPQDLWTMKQFYFTDRQLPGVLNRAEVVKKTTVEESPLENAVGR